RRSGWPRPAQSPRSARRGILTISVLAEAFNSLFKAELIRNKGPFTSIEDLEIAVAGYVDWFNHRRVHGEIGMVPRVEFEDVYHHENPVPAPAGTALASL
ncbi:IS3 family transposase, partial [Micrococcus sp. ACRRV]|uniref:IS3 family transposase n=1 Tax=Micrococcus sp. ACRRV TaxID=2918203 RepID=UPI001EF1F95E